MVGKSVYNKGILLYNTIASKVLQSLLLLGGFILKLYIHTLGNFDILFNGESILKESSRSYKLYRLLQYFITHKGRKLLPEIIIDDLYQENESGDPKNVLRTQIFRLRRILKKLISEKIVESKYFSISAANGYYCFELGESVLLDIDEFERYIALGDKENYDEGKALEYYKKALQIYKGPYLSLNAYENWLVPIRNRYSRLYLKTFYKCMELLELKDDNYGIIELCEEALVIDPYEETIQICLINAMLRLGQIKNAMSYYDYIKVLQGKEMSVRLSPALMNIYRKILSYYDEKSVTDLESIATKLTDENFEGALLCDYDYFRFLYNIEKRKGLRTGNSGYLCLISINRSYFKNNGEEKNDMARGTADFLGKILRKGDTYSFWNDNQILLMLHELKQKDVDKVERRIKEGLRSNLKTDNNIINIDFEPLISNFSIEKMYKAY